MSAESKPFKDFGTFVREIRISIGFTLRKFCEEFGYDLETYSKMERGFASPPSSMNGQTKLAKELCLHEGSDGWKQFFSHILDCKGKFHPLGLTEEESIVQLPLVFKTTHGEKLDEDKLLEFAQSFRSM
ncbi:MAG: helix-turn-helix domain-containing protein [Chitinispirillia bacterium]|nr:helix-turn-helix domain-containing protein [Chitinispirillia bacterium]